jgi:hypothetical protein
LSQDSAAGSNYRELIAGQKNQEGTMPQSGSPAQGRILRPLLLLLATVPGLAGAHGFAGKRFFPATLTFDDPFTADEFDLLYSAIPNARNDDGDSVDLSGLDFEWAKSITPNFALSVGSAYVNSKFADGSTQYGFDNIELSAKVLGGVDDVAESMWSYGLDVDLGGTSSHGVGEDFTVYSPSFYFGKGFGSLFDAGSYLRPLAVTGKLAVDVPDQGDQPTSLDTDFSLQYSLTYLESAVKDVGLPQFLRDSVLLVELPLETCLNKECDGDVTGTVNPGIAFVNHYGQLSLEAVIPVNDRTGSSVGALLQVHFYLDDIFPHSLGKPLFD